MENSFKRFLIKKFGLYFLILLLKKTPNKKPTSPKRSNFSLEYKYKKKKRYISNDQGNSLENTVDADYFTYNTDLLIVY